MFDKDKLVLAGIVVLTTAHDIRTQQKIRQIAKTALELTKSKETQIATQHLQIAYLCHLLNKHDIPADEFDLIALNFEK